MLLTKMGKNKHGKPSTSIPEVARNLDTSFASISESPSKSPMSKRLCSDNDESIVTESDVTNADILKAVNGLSNRFTVLEQQMVKNTISIINISKTVDFTCEELKSLTTKLKTTEENIEKMTSNVTELQNRAEDVERYSRRWNLRLSNLRENSGENIRMEVFDLLATIAPEEKSKLGFLVDSESDDFVKTTPHDLSLSSSRVFKEKIWKMARDAEVMKERRHRFSEDLTKSDRQSRLKLWPFVQKARSEGKKTFFKGPYAYIDGQKVNF